MILATGLTLVATPRDAAADVYTRRNARGVLEATDQPSEAGYELTYRSKGVVRHAPGFRPDPERAARYLPYILEASEREGISPELIRAVIRTESNFDDQAVSSAGARGLMQLMPAAAARFGVSDPFDARQNVLGGTRYLRVLLRKFDGDLGLALAAYNAGERTVTRHGGIPPFPETRRYVEKILALLGGADATVRVSVASASLPSGPAPPAPRPAVRVLYKWEKDGRVSVAQAPPSDGSAYTVLRLTD